MTRQYKDSGIEWIGQIPMDWKMQPLAIYFAENSKSNSDLGSVNALQFKYGEIIQKPNNGKELTDKDRELLEKYTVVSPDDIVVNGLNLNYDLKSLRIAKVREDGIITSAYIVLRPRNGANASFYNYYLKALDFQKIFHGMGVGIRLTLSYDELRSMLLAVPSLEEQQHIADYLDKKCAEIDGLIELQEQMTAQLTDYKQSVITEAVTKGLNPNVEFVPSGVDWIGDIPKGWKVGKVSYFYSVCLGKMLQPNSSSVEDTYENYYCAANVGQNNIKYEPLKQMWFSPTEKKQYEVKVGDLLVVEGGDVASCDIVKKDMGNVYFQNALHRVRSRHFDDVRILRYLLMTAKKIGHIELICNKATISHFTKEKFENVRIPLPPKEEQEVIVSYLDSKCSEIDKLIALKQQKIETLKEYKKSLIFECVTGKKEIN